jgi:hypothetical protein
VTSLLLAAALASTPVHDYRAFTALATESPGDASAVVLRSFTRGSERFLWVVDPATLVARAVPATRLRIEPRPWSAIRRAIAATAYGRALRDAEHNAAPLQDAGLVRVRPGRAGIDLTLDLCPSRRPLDRALISTLVGGLAGEEKPLPVAIALTGAWMQEHPDDLAWLRSLEEGGTLAVTWVNHSFHHRTNPTLPLASNFLLEPGTDVRNEVLQTERSMLAAGLTPSVFFRFPGLVSRPDIFAKVVALGLVPLGSDAWLAKNQRPGEGSIVLVHANGNEPLGVRRFLELLRTERERIRAGTWQLLDLRESVVETESGPAPER